MGFSCEAELPCHRLPLWQFVFSATGWGKLFWKPIFGPRSTQHDAIHLKYFGSCLNRHPPCTSSSPSSLWLSSDLPLHKGGFPSSLMSLPLLLTFLFGGAAGLAVGWSVFSKGKGISRNLQAEIDRQQHELDQVKVSLSEARSAVKTTEIEAKATAKEILSDAKIQANEIVSKLQNDVARAEEKERSLDQKTKEVERQRENLKREETEVTALKEELKTTQQQHRMALEKVAKLSTEEAKNALNEELQEEFRDRKSTRLNSSH